MWEDTLSQDLARREGTDVQPRHSLLVGTALRALLVAGTAWGADRQPSFPDAVSDRFAELEEALLETQSDSVSEQTG
jgi:hypothetical protein